MNLGKYNKVFMDVFDVDEAALNDEFTFQNVSSWDSIAHMSLTTTLEDAFDIMLDTEDILTFGSYENGIEIMKKYGIEL